MSQNVADSLNFTNQMRNCAQHNNKLQHHHQHQQQQQPPLRPKLIKSHSSAYQLNESATLNAQNTITTTINKALMPPLDYNQAPQHHVQQQQQQKQHYCYHQKDRKNHHTQQQQQQQQQPKSKSKFYITDDLTLTTSPHHHQHQHHQNNNHKSPPHHQQQHHYYQQQLNNHQQQKQHRNNKQPRRSRSASKSRRNSSYHSYDDLDAAATTAERKVVSSLKYLCACTGATLRNLSKKTKDLHAKNYYYTKPTWRLWGEETEKNAIFTVYLKKVRYHRPTPTASNDSDDEISHLEWETVRVRFVKAATLARLVEALATDDGELESTFINVFLSTYRTFSTPKEVLSLLTRRYDTLHEKHLEEIEQKQSSGDTTYDPHTSTHEQHKKTLVSALHVWLDGFPEDWNEENLQQILAFASKRLKRSELHIKVLNRLERLLRQQVYGGGAGGGGGVAAEHNGMPPWLIAGSAGAQGLLLGTVNGCPYGNNYELAEQFSELCLGPAATYHVPTHFLQAFRFPHVPVRHFAEQLTRMDSELFKRLIPHQCLGATWARRDKSGSETVVATINQFNAVLFRVISSILIEQRLRPQERALNIATWIDIAQELRLLKNFSSLKAIISGLQSNSIYRLSKVWEVLPKERMEIFTELARIFSEDNNAWTQREVLMREGTAKFADTVGEQDRHLQKIIQKQSTQTSHGTIPYLGTFLTDLTMIHAAIPDTITEDQLINFDKKRKEFEVLAQIKLLQGAANTYNLHEDPIFNHWFASMPVLNEREAHTMSCQLEPPPPAPRKSTASTNTSLTNTTHTSASSANSIGGGHRKTDSIASNSSSGAGSQFYCELNSSLTGSHYSSRHNSLDRDAPNVSQMSASSSVSNLSFDSSNSGGGGGISKSNSKMTHSHSTNGVVRNALNTSVTSHNGSPLINAQLVQPAGNGGVGGAQNNAPNFYIIRVTYETDNIELDGIVLYKSIMLGNNERTPQVIRNAMLKLGLEDDPERYTLAQVLPDKELVMPKNANVYYAVNTNYNLNFILRPRREGSKDGS